MTDTEKLRLIMEHADSYYVNNREYHFVEGGFVSYETSEFDDKKILYIADIFVTVDARGGNTFSKLIHYCQMLGACEGADLAYASTEIQNPYLDRLQNMYAKVGFVEYSRDDTNIYYRLEL